MVLCARCHREILNLFERESKRERLPHPVDGASRTVRRLLNTAKLPGSWRVRLPARNALTAGCITVAMFRTTVLPLCLFVSPVFAAAITVEQLLSAPFPSNLTACRTAGKIAWVLDEKGARNIWVAEKPGYKRPAPYQLHNGRWTGDRRPGVDA